MRVCVWVCVCVCVRERERERERCEPAWIGEEHAGLRLQESSSCLGLEYWGNWTPRLTAASQQI